MSVEHLLQQPKGKTLEFKRDLSSPRNVLKTLVAFANAAEVRLAFKTARFGAMQRENV